MDVLRIHALLLWFISLRQLDTASVEAPEVKVGGLANINASAISSGITKGTSTEERGTVPHAQPITDVTGHRYLVELHERENMHTVY